MTIRNTAESMLLAMWVVALSSLAFVTGCFTMPVNTEAPFPWKQRFMADVAIVSATLDTGPSRPQPKVGDRCRDCNDPPGACGVGRVGDGRDCDRCGTCGGDGRIDERDLTGDTGDVTAEPSLPVRSIALHMSHGSQSWGGKWWHESRQAFIDAGWDVLTTVRVEGVIPAPFFVVVDGDTSTQFHEPLTAELLEGWER